MICRVTDPQTSRGRGCTLSSRVTLPSSQSSLDGVYSTVGLVELVNVPVPLNAAILH